jgi:hypothetical protein
MRGQHELDSSARDMYRHELLCLVIVLPNTRVKLSAPTSKGIHLFVKTKTLRRSLRAFR